jgi:hypothetical protein
VETCRLLGHFLPLIPMHDISWTPIAFARQLGYDNLYWWQDDVLTWYEPIALLEPGTLIKGTLCTPNGSGKSSVVFMLLALWWISVFRNGRFVVTTKDDKQLTGQLWESLIRQESKFPAWTFRRSEKLITNNLGGWIRGWTTDEPGRAEGWHNLEKEEGPLFLGIDEAKSVKEEIFGAMDRCTPNAILYASSTGLKEGSFYKSHTDPKLGFNRMKIGLTDCPHIPKSKQEWVINKWGPDHPMTRSILYGEFMDEDESTRYVVPPTAYRLLMDNLPQYQPGPKSAFCDFAANGAENVLAFKRGNQVTIEAAWSDPNTMASVGRFILEFVRLGLSPSEIYGDDGGLGHSMIDRMYEMGWPINRVNFGGSPTSPQYRDLGTEIWFTGSDKIQRLSCILPVDDILEEQTITRKVVPRSDGIMEMESKKMLSARGLASPDRSDAVMGVLCVADKLETVLFDLEGLAHVEAASRVSNPEMGSLDMEGRQVVYRATSRSPWLTVWERPEYGLSYLGILNPLRLDLRQSHHVLYILRDAYDEPRLEKHHNIRLVARLSLPCKLDTGPLVEMTSRLLDWYGNPVLVPIVRDRGDVVMAFRSAGVPLYTKRDFQRDRRGKPSNVIEFGWQVNSYSQSLWIASLADAIREKKLDVEDLRLVMQLYHLKVEDDWIPEAETLGVGLQLISLASRRTPPRVDFSNDVLSVSQYS